MKIFHRTFEPSGCAACTRSEVFGPAVLLNSSNVRWRRNFDLAHELFHLLTWGVYRSESERASSAAGEEEERLATCFARHLLMPVESFMASVDQQAKDGKIAFQALYDIAREFDVSIEAVLWQMHFVYNRGLDKVEQTQKDIERAKALAPLFEEARRQDTPAPKWPDRYQALAMKALRDGNISIGRYAEYLDISRNEAISCAEQEIPDGQEIQIGPA